MKTKTMDTANNNKLNNNILNVISELSKLSDLTNNLDLSNDENPFFIQTEKIESKLWLLIVKSKKLNLINSHAQLMRAYVAFIDCAPEETENILNYITC